MVVSTLFVLTMMVLAVSHAWCAWLRRQERNRFLDRDGDFKVDAVYTWVDGSDEEWRDMIAHYWEEASEDKNLHHNQLREPMRRTDHRDEMFYSLRSVCKNLPWVSRVHIVAQRPQIPMWMNGEREVILPCPGQRELPVRVIYHDEFFDQESKRHLPVFNSNLIQSQIHNIPDLAERFILFDDDMFVGRPMRKCEFFKFDGRPVYATDPVFYWCLTRMDQWGSQCRNLLRMGREKRLGQAFALKHVPAALTKSDCRLTQRLFMDEYRRLQRFRSFDDFCIQYLVALVASKHPEGSGVHWGERDGLEYWDGEKKVHSKLVQKTLPRLFCINQDVTPAILDDLERHFPS